MKKDNSGKCPSIRRLSNQFARVIDAFSKKTGSGFASLTSISTVIMIVTGTLDVLGTKLFNMPVPSTYESTETLMVALVFGGLSYAQLQNRHIRVEFVIQRLRPPLSNIVNTFGLLIGLIFFVFFTWTAGDYFWQSWLIREAEPSVIQFPIYPAKFILLMGSALLTLQLLIDVIKSLVGLFSDR